tara:strand:+ start:581 stop:868 length:288 start_codon:yes stop_codon:yes gene_type:complete
MHFGGLIEVVELEDREVGFGKDEAAATRAGLSEVPALEVLQKCFTFSCGRFGSSLTFFTTFAARETLFASILVDIVRGLQQRSASGGRDKCADRV